VHRSFLFLSIACFLLCGFVSSATPAIEIKVLLRAPFSGDDGKEGIVASGVFPPGSSTGRHFHSGDEYGTVLEGALEIIVDGQPAKRVNAGESYHNGRGVVHRTGNTGTVPARVISTFVIDKGRPIVEAVAASGAKMESRPLQ
jgi:quercetin dioxygenase-like cupin family protein